MWTVSVMQLPRAGAIRVVTGPPRGLFLPVPGLARAGPGWPGSQPWRIQLSGGSDPDGVDSADGWCWQSHQVPPGQSSCWCFRHGTQIMIPIVPF
jgi:hypothetical protein